MSKEAKIIGSFHTGTVYCLYILKKLCTVHWIYSIVSLTFHMARNVMLTAWVYVLFNSRLSSFYPYLNYHLKYLNWYAKAGLQWKSVNKSTIQFIDSWNGWGLVQLLTQSRLLRAVSSWVLTTSRDGDSITHLGNLLQYLITLKIWGTE